MSRSLIAAAVLATCVAVPFSSCTANLTESCISGPCTLTGGGGDNTGSGGGGGSADGGSTDGGSDGADGGEPNAASCPQVAQTGDFPCDVFAVIHSVCNPCHQNPPQNGAPFPLLTYADTQQLYTPSVGLIFQQMFISTGPAGSPRMPFGEAPLMGAQYATLHGWLGQCAPPVPAGTGCGCPGMGCDGGQ